MGAPCVNVLGGGLYFLRAPSATGGRLAAVPAATCHRLLHHSLTTMSPMVSTMCLSLLAAPGLAFVTPFVAEQVRAPVATSRSSTPRSIHMIATDKAVNTGVKRNENFAKLKVGDWCLVCGCGEAGCDEAVNGACS